jgi:hypothetical protein
MVLAGICLLRPVDLGDPEIRYLVKVVLDKATAVVRQGCSYNMMFKLTGL